MRDGSGLSISDPSAEIEPLVGCSRPEMSRSNVDLPHPDGPSSATNSPAATERSINSSTGSREPSSSNAWLTPRMSIATLRAAAGGARNAVAVAAIR